MIGLLRPLSDLKLHLQSTDYGHFLANEAGPLSVTTIDDRLRDKLVLEIQHIRNHSVEPLSTFIDYITSVARDGSDSRRV